jgi:hypothetical protein
MHQVSAAIDLTELDAMLDATLTALIQLVEAGSDGMASFGVGDGCEPLPPEVEELYRMVELARGQSIGERTGEDEAALGFAVGEDEHGMWARIRRESTEPFDGLLSVLASSHVIETGEGPTRIRTHVGWLGDTRTQLARGVTSELVAAHVSATQASLTQRAHRLHVLAMVLDAARRITEVIAAPSGAVIALPIAYKCVRAVHRRWIASNPDSRGRATPW